MAAAAAEARPRIGPGDQINYKNMSLINRFIEQGKILSRRINRLILKQQQLITLAIKQALSIITGPRPRKNRHIPQLTQKFNSNGNLRNSN
ncbi:hypothetical protein DAI22_07g082766 [Oryza sativa Japonica Group]|nr:hypothetical protein DAI22_07g082766 [Oryza sativa Japonica Group]